MKTAVIGIGSNSLRLLVADHKDGQMTAILRKREGLRVFASLNQQNEISDAMILNACHSVENLRLAAKAAGAQRFHLFATSAVRDAANQQALVDALLRTTGLKLEIISGEREARLSFVGATENVRSGLIDIGGGSTEIVIGKGDHLEFACSLQAGAVRMYRQIPVNNAQDTLLVQQAMRALIKPYQEKLSKIKTPTEWVGVGGTMTVLATCSQNIAWNQHDSIQSFTAKRSDVKRIMINLAQMPLDMRRSMPCIPPDRADIVVHGFAILLACMEELNIEQIRISRQTNLDGYLKLMKADG